MKDFCTKRVVKGHCELCQAGRLGERPEPLPLCRVHACVQPRSQGPEYDELVTEFMTAAQEVYGPQVLLQVRQTV